MSKKLLKFQAESSQHHHQDATRMSSRVAMEVAFRDPLSATDGLIVPTKMTRQIALEVG